MSPTCTGVVYETYYFQSLNFLFVQSFSLEKLMIKKDLINGTNKTTNNFVLPLLKTTNPVQQTGSIAWFEDDSIKFSNGKEWKSLFPDTTPENYITVHPTAQGVDYTNIEDALAYASTLLPTTSGIMIYPSTYTENNPLVVPSGVSIFGLSGVLTTTVVCQNAGSNAFEVSTGSVIEGITIVGGSRGINFNGVVVGNKLGSIISDVIVNDSAIGIASSTGPGELICMNTLVRSNTSAVNIGYLCESGGIMRCSSCGATGIVSNKISYGLLSRDANSLLVYFSGGVQYCTRSIRADNNGRVEAKSIFCRYSDITLSLGPTNTQSVLLADDTTVLDTVLYDIDIESTAGKLCIFGGQVRFDMINNPNNVEIFASSFSKEPDNETQQVLGDFSVGLPTQQTESSLGSGTFYVNGMTVLTDNGTGTNFINITANAKNPTVVNNFLQGLTAGNVIYIGSSNNNFKGFKLSVVTPWAAGNSDNTIKEYWNGAAWTALPIMVTKATSPYSSRTDVILETSELQCIRFGKMPGFSLNTVNGISSYWIRIRANVNLTAPMATFSRIELIPSTTKVNGDGFLEYFGNAEPIRILSWDLGQLEPAASGPATQDVFISDNLDVGKTENSFQNGATDRIGFNTYLPRDIDTSYGVKFRWSYNSTATGGDIDWVIRWGWTNDGFMVYPSLAAAPPVGVNEQSISFSTPVTVPIGQQVTETRNLSIPKVNARPPSGNPDMLWITLQRTIGDTHAGNVVAIQVQGEYVAFCEGGYATEF